MESDEWRLVLANMRLVDFFAKRYRAPAELSREEYCGEMVCAMWRAAKTYDSTLGAFSTYAIRGMRLRICQIRRKLKTVSERGFGRSIYLPDGSLMDLPAPEIACSAFDSVDQDLVSVFLGHLKSAHREIVELHMAGRSFREIAIITGATSHQAVSRQYSAALRWMRRTAQIHRITAESAGL